MQLLWSSEGGILRFKTIILLVSTLYLAGCTKNGDSPTPAESSIVSSDYVTGQSATQLQSYLQISGVGLPLDELKYNVEAYKTSYISKYKGDQITASGLIILPSTDQPVGVLSFQHGTISDNSQAPSNIAAGSTELIFYEALASLGYVTVVPDYFGFGSSSDLLHPYFVKEPTTVAVIDNIKAAKQFASEKKIKLNGQLFIAGYSQGGYATMATHEAIEKTPIGGLDLIASFPASGGYYIKGMQEYFFSLQSYDQPFFIAFVAYAYKTYYNWGETLSLFFNEPYATDIPALFDGSKSGSQINASLTDNITTLINADILANIDSDSKYDFINTEFDENSVTHWTPKIPVYMYHGTADVTVPYQNSVDTYNQLLANGASTDILTLTSLEGSTHYTGVEPYFEQFVPVMLSLTK